jgi:hypothetical protein
MSPMLRLCLMAVLCVTVHIGAAEASESLCGQPGAANVSQIADWDQYQCGSRTQAGPHWASCLRQAQYSNQEGTGCPGYQRCCPANAFTEQALTATSDQDDGMSPAKILLCTIGASFATGILLVFILGARRPWTKQPMKVEFSAQTLNYVNACPCCGESEPDGMYYAVASRTTGIRVKRTTKMSWGFPTCSPCIAHASLWETRFIPFLLLILINMIAFAVLFFQPESPQFAWKTAIVGNPVVALIATGLSLRRWNRSVSGCKPSCVFPGPATQYLRWYGSIQTFRFLSSDFARAYIAANRSKVINRPGWQ